MYCVGADDDFRRGDDMWALVSISRPALCELRRYIQFACEQSDNFDFIHNGVQLDSEIRNLIVDFDKVMNDSK